MLAANTSRFEAADLGPYLQEMVAHNASDLFLTVGALATVKVEGKFVALDTEPLASGEVKLLAYSVMTELQIRNFERDLECDLALTVAGRESSQGAAFFASISLAKTCFIRTMASPRGPVQPDPTLPPPPH